MTKRKPNPQRGGRKPSGNVRHTVSLPPALWAHVDAQAGNTRSARLAVVVGEHRALHWLLAMVDKPGWIDPPPVGVELDPAYVEIAKQRVEEALAKG